MSENFSTKEFVLTLTEITTNQTARLGGSYSQFEFSSAEWVVGATVTYNACTISVMADFNSVQFSNDYAAVSGQSSPLTA